MEHVNAFLSRNAKWLLIAALAGSFMAVGCTGPILTEDEDDPEPEAEAPAEPTTRTVDGFRIQVMSTSDKAEADERVADVLDWWEDVPQNQRPAYHKSDDLPIEIAWRQPYYRVRLGTFASRGEAERALSVVQQHYQDAFIVPDRVTITR